MSMPCGSQFEVARTHIFADSPFPLEFDVPLLVLSDWRRRSSLMGLADATGR